MSVISSARFRVIGCLLVSVLARGLSAVQAAEATPEVVQVTTGSRTISSSAAMPIL